MSNNNNQMEKYMQMKTTYRLIIASILAALTFGSCSTLFGSSLSQDEIRATAYHIATTQLATTIDPQAAVMSTVDPGLPTPTTDPTICPPAEVAVWKIELLTELEALGVAIETVMHSAYEIDDIDEIIARIRTRSNELRQFKYPRCGEKSMRRLGNVYDQLVVVLEAAKSGDSDRIFAERTTLTQARVKLKRALKEIFPGEEFLEIENVLEKYYE